MYRSVSSHNLTRFVPLIKDSRFSLPPFKRVINDGRVNILSKFLLFLPTLLAQNNIKSLVCSIQYPSFTIPQNLLPGPHRQYISAIEECQMFLTPMLIPMPSGG